MASHHHAPFGSLNTPLYPAEALARFSPLKSCGIAPLNPAKRSESSRWRYEYKNWWVEEGKATVFTRSVSASAISGTEPGKIRHAGCIAHERLASLRNRIAEDQYLDRHPRGYTPEQLAGYNLYSIKSKRLSSGEYGVNGPPASPETAPPPSRTPPRSATPPRIVELEGSPSTASPSKFQTPPISATLYADSPVEYASHAISPTKRTCAMTIVRKPVGSGISPKASRTSDPLLMWSRETSESLDGRESKHHYIKSYDSTASPYRRQHAGSSYRPWEMDSSPTTASRGLPTTPGSNNNSRPKQPVRFRSDSDHIPEQAPLFSSNLEVHTSPSRKRNSPPTPPSSHKDTQQSNRNRRHPYPNIPAIAETLGFETPELNVQNFLFQDYDCLRDWLIYALKLLFLLYLAACVWNILSAVKDGVVRALEPVIAVWSFARWVVGTTR